MIRFTSTRTRRRRTALTVLLVWLFATAAGWANACVIQYRHAHAHGSTDLQVLSAHAPPVSPGHLGADSDHPENAGAAKSACLKFCGDGAQTPVKLTPGIDLLDLPMAPLRVLAWATRQAAAMPASARLESPSPSTGLPLRTRFSRLAL